jgi:uncharacterized protein YndB with AHSA1/START domain
MAEVERLIPATPEHVFAVLADGWTYSDWMVGTAHVRDVDRDYPALGTRIRAEVGPWPLTIRDESLVLECEAPYLLLLKIPAWPAGTYKVRVILTPVGDNATRATLTAEPVSGPLRRLRAMIYGPVPQRRNRESLRRLGDLAARKAHRPSATGA